MPPSKAHRALIAQRRVKALQLRTAGATLAEIAETLGYTSAATVSKDLARAYQAAIAAEVNAVTEWRELELARLDRIQRGHWTAAISGNPKTAMVVLACIDRRIKLLGLDAPVKVEATVQDADSAQALAVQKLVNEARALAANTASSPAEEEVTE